MEINYNSDDFAGWIGKICRGDLVSGENEYKYEFGVRDLFDEGSIELVIEKTKLENIIKNLRSYSVVDETVISNGYIFETLVREEGPFRRFNRGRNNNTVFEINDETNKLIYRLIRPSNEFTLFLIAKAESVSSARDLWRPVYSSSMMRRKLADKPCPLDLVKQITSGRLSLQIESTEGKNDKEFESLSSAFLFHLTYNTDTALIQQRDFEELLRSARINRVRQINLDELEPPRRSYIPDLIHYYQLAVGSENPMLEFISYYHIAEHFFESVFNDDLIDKVKNKITHVDFSYRRKNDISSLIKDISKAVKLRDESMTFSEQEGLRLTLEKYVKLDELRIKIQSYNEDLIEYYKLHQVPFSGGTRVDLNSSDDRLLYKHLSARIYQTRNSIVHSKESEKSKYTPFKDDKQLVQEVPLIRFIAEQIINNTSKIM